jgi:putative oxidoreductase
LKYSNLASLFGRQLFSIIFILSSASHFKPPTVEYAVQHGVPLASLLVPLSGIVALVGGLSVLLGYQTRLGAWLLTLFLIPVTLVMHNFWAAPDATAFQAERALFLRNVALLGGALLVGWSGGGPLSLDALIHREKEVVDRTSPSQAARVRFAVMNTPVPWDGRRQSAGSRAPCETPGGRARDRT